MRNSLESIRQILKLARMSMEHVVDAHVYLKDIGQMDSMSTIFKEYFPINPPAGTTVQVIQHPLEQVQVTAVR
jgi:2-iminobutanoate/2-iminopropanoate deaminase